MPLLRIFVTFRDTPPKNTWKRVMGEKLLLAIDGSRNSLLTLDYVSHFFKVCPEVRLVLYHVLPPIPPVYKETSLQDTSALNYIREWKKRHQEAIDQVLHRSKEKLLKIGWKDSQVRIQAQEKRIGLARDILFEARQGVYDTIVLGRRGISKTKEFFMGGVSSKILQRVEQKVVWIVG